MKKQQQRKNTKWKWPFRSLLFILICMVSAGVYIITQYNQGLSEAKDGQYKEDETTFDPFHGVEPEFGEINILMVGSDARGDELGLSDTIMIAQYNQDTNDLRLVSIMRDTYVEIPDYGMQKINAAFSFGGPELLRKTIKQTFDIDLYYYAVVDFEGFSKLADIIAPDGIEVDIPHEMSEGIGMTLEPGRQRLHGEELLGYVRFRKDIYSDYGRVERQQEIIAKLKDEAVSVHSFINLPKILGMSDPYIDTNLDYKTILSIGKGLIAEGNHPIETLRIPVDDSYQNIYKDVGDVLDIDLIQNKQELQNFLSVDNEMH